MKGLVGWKNSSQRYATTMFKTSMEFQEPLPKRMPPKVFPKNPTAPAVQSLEESLHTVLGIFERSLSVFRIVSVFVE